jgi:CRISPR-associated protein (TIGR03984 family)
MSQTTLFVHHRERVSLTEALSAFVQLGGKGAVALLYSPRSCELTALASGELRSSEGRPVDLSAVFEARVFSKDAELRWLNDPGHARRHRAVILAEQDCSASLGDSWSKKSIDIIDTLDQTYLLWGEGTGKAMPPGWSQLGAARIGALLIPLAGVGKKQRVLLETREYFEEEQEHGNVLVRDERLCGLKLEEVERG